MARFRKITAVSLAAALMLANPTTPASAQAEDGPGCRIEPASPSVGADIPQSYFAPPASTDNPSFVGSLQLLTTGQSTQPPAP